ncbi:MAG: type I-U CRISPR-associated protein Cas5/Cas6 [Rhodocyclaceae bacterium]|nr:type I-U CRISPR-associated protein Cas5/Cas6 [Rhodocyclaceae bacterium]MBX3670652.1 type I-U CRISPR-associated protein Cas5/Cas6 [Rhodocyclaceae bacterium]
MNQRIPDQGPFASAAAQAVPAASHYLYELSQATGEPAAGPSALHCVQLTERLRDAAAANYLQAHPEHADLVERLFVGRAATAADKPLRLRLVLLPCARAAGAELVARHLLLHIPSACPLQGADLVRAFAGLTLQQPHCALRPVAAIDVLQQYGIEHQAAWRWQSITPLALPASDTAAEADGPYADAQSAARYALRQALRQFDPDLPPARLSVQRAAYTTAAAPSAHYAAPPRFAAARLWHVELEFTRPVPGPLLLGDGRYLGLGLMRPALPQAQGAYAYAIAGGLTAAASAASLSHALRRALMARVQQVLGALPLPAWFSGHSADGGVLRDAAHAHIACAADAATGRLWIFSPHRLAQRAAGAHELFYLQALERAAAGLTELNAGRAGRLQLSALQGGKENDALLAPARVWESITDYRPARHPHAMQASAALAQDLRQELQRHGLPMPDRMEVLQAWQGPAAGLYGRFRLHFACPVPGPLLLGRTRHKGGGLFRGVA